MPPAALHAARKKIVKATPTCYQYTFPAVIICGVFLFLSYFMQDQAHTRRNFFIAAINGLGALLGAAVAIPAAAYLLIRPKSESESGFAEVGDVSQLKVGQPQEILYERKRVDGWKKITEKTSTWLVKTDAHTVIAYNPACTHLGCAYHWDASGSHFICPCHASVFSIDGKVLAGPAPRPLDRYVAKVEDGKILIGSQVVAQG
jgi:menaquinol-cytochrome c reductase iron-sulfur subunit